MPFHPLLQNRTRPPGLLNPAGRRAVSDRAGAGSGRIGGIHGGLKRGIRLVEQGVEQGIPYLGRIAAGRPIEAIANTEPMRVPDELQGKGPCFVLQVCGDSMIDAGIHDGDYVVIEQQEYAQNGDIVVALIHKEEATLKRIEQRPGEVILHPANHTMSAMVYRPEEVSIQGVLRGLLRFYT
ncbi:MAG: transcriptional repressor LexA [Candidatus Thiodiazotropha sp.]